MSVANLTKKERLFVAEFEKNNGDAVYAAKLAGFPVRVCADAYKQLLSRPAVIVALAKQRVENDIHPEDFPTEETEFPHDFLSIEESDFVIAYIRKHNVKDACDDCGISSQLGSRWFNDPRVRGAIDCQLEAQADRKMLSGDRVISEMMKIAFFNIQWLYDEEGSPLPIQDLDERHSAAIAEIYQDNDGVFKYKTIDKMKALLVLMDFLELIGPGREGAKGDSPESGKDISDIEVMTKLMSIIKKGQQ